MKLKQRHKEYFKENNIKSISDLALKLIELKQNRSNLKIEDVQALFDITYLLVNAKDELEGFFNIAEQRRKVIEKPLLEEAELHQKSLNTGLFDPPIKNEAERILSPETPLPQEVKDWLESPLVKQECRIVSEEFDQLVSDVRERKRLRENLSKTYKNTAILDFGLLREEIKVKQPYKETEGKLFYELDWDFVKQMAERMASNKENNKYDLWNWKKSMSPKTLTDLKQATMRHLIEVMEGRYEDDGRKLGHIEAISTNMMMINYQLKLNE